jgi:uncharacterized protein YqgV (UPF0045/DUF77 family)
MMRTIKLNSGETVLVPEDTTEEQVGQMLEAHRNKPVDDPDNHRAEFMASVLVSQLAPIQEALAAIHETIAMKDIEIEFSNEMEAKFVKEMGSSIEKALESFGQTAITKQTGLIQTMLDGHMQAIASMIENKSEAIDRNTEAFNTRIASLEKTIAQSVDKLVAAQTAPRELIRDKNGDAAKVVVAGKKKDGLFD